MYIIYSDIPDRTSKAKYAKGDANTFYLTHYRNMMQLMHVFRTAASMLTRIQADNEIKICQKKLTYWQNKAEFDWTYCLPKIQEIKKQGFV